MKPYSANIIDVNTRPILNAPHSNAPSVELSGGNTGTKCTHYGKPAIP